MTKISFSFLIQRLYLPQLKNKNIISSSSMSLLSVCRFLLPQGITVFCLMNTQSVLQFIFDCIDKDDDDKITKNDIKTFLQYQNPINNQHTFFINFLPKIDKLKLKQNQTLLDFEQFRSNSDKLYFLIWPAYQLQQTFRNQTLGQSPWYQLYSKAEKREYEIKNNEKKETRLKQKLQILKTLNKKEQGPFFKDQLKNRKPFQVSTDLNIENHQTRPKRNSCPYLKPSFIIDKDSINLQNK